MQIAFKNDNEHTSLRYKVLSDSARTTPIKYTTPEILPTSGVSQSTLDQKNKNNKVDIFSNRSDLMIAIASISMHLPERLRQDIVKQVSEILNPEHINYDGCLINLASFIEFLQFIVLKNMKPAAYSVSSKSNFMASWFYDEDRIHIEFVGEKLYKTVASKKNNSTFEYYTHNGDLLALEKFITNNDFSRLLYGA